MTARCDTRTTKAAYALGAGAYDDAWSPVILPAAEAAVRRLDLARASCVLDVGAGTGALTPALRAAAPHATIISIDPALEMLRYARHRRQVTPARADAAALPVAGGVADAVLLAYVLFMLADPPDGLREAERVLRPGGRVATVTWGSEEPSLAAKCWEATLDELGVPVLSAHSNHSGLDTAEGVSTQLTDVGLLPLDVWCERIDATIDPDNFWRLRTTHGTNGVRLARLDAARRDVVLTELRRRLASLRRSDYRVRGTLVCSVSAKPNVEGDR
jgi:SAM-dependent methyltransferase